MDIDEFLDRELADLGSDLKEEKSNEPLFKDAQGQSPLIGSIKLNLSKGSLEEAEQSYLQLWHLLAQQKLDWNNNIYEQLHSLSIRISSILGQAYEETKRKSSQITELISRGRDSMKEGKKDLPLKIYAQIQDINNSIPNVFFEEKKRVQEQVMNYYGEITSANDAELIKKVAVIIQEVAQLMENAVFSIKSSDVESASSSYYKCLQLYNQIPEGFMIGKSQAGIRLLDIYKNLSIQMQIANLQKQLGQQSQVRQLPFTPMPYAKILSKPVEQKYYALKAKPVALQNIRQKKSVKEISSRHSMLERKKHQAKRNIKSGFYNEAWKDIEEALQIEPRDVEAKALRAKIKTLQ